MKIAVCFSGEPRTWQHTAEAIKYFFSSDVHDYKFFGHTWNHSHFNKECMSAGQQMNHDHPIWNDYYDTQELHDNLTETLGITSLLVEDKNVVSAVVSKNCLINPGMNINVPRARAANMRKPVGWSFMSYSKMKANSLKTKYELENEMQFDVVVSARYDVCYPPDSRFDHLLQYHGPLLPVAVYGETNYYPNEFFLPHINELFYFGNSRVMNIVDEFYRYYSSGKFWEMMDEKLNDSVLKFCGYGPNLYRWLTIKNILMVSKFQPYGVFRKTAQHLTWPQDWNAINEANSNLFR